MHIYNFAENPPRDVSRGKWGGGVEGKPERRGGEGENAMHGGQRGGGI